MKNVIILGAAGRDFHNFNVYFKNNRDYKVVAFTATQIPNIDGRTYPVQLTGKQYPYGIPIHSESELPYLIKKYNVEQCIFSYSDVSYQHVMNVASIVNTAGADFRILGIKSTMLNSLKPVIAVCSTRSGSGKGQTARKISQYLTQKGKKVVIVKHPMPYGDLKNQIMQRFARYEDLKKYNCTIEEMEGIEPHIKQGNVVYTGLDYHDVLRAAEDDQKGCDIIIWEGGNNDMPFFNPDFMITVADPHRVGHECSYYPSELNIRMSDVVLINKVDTANGNDVLKLRKNILSINPTIKIIEAASPIEVVDSKLITNEKVLVIEDGPTLTYGEMKTGAGLIAAEKFSAAELIDPRDYAVGSIKEVYSQYKDIPAVLPAMGYSKEQVIDLEETIKKIPCDSIVIATQVDLAKIVKINKPYTRVHFEMQELGSPNLHSILDDLLKKL